MLQGPRPGRRRVAVVRMRYEGCTSIAYSSCKIAGNTCARSG